MNNSRAISIQNSKSVVPSIWGSLKEVYGNASLIVNIVRYDLKLSYSNLFLGYIWTILDPLLLLGVYVVLVQYILNRGGPMYPMLVFASILCWKWFTSSVSAGLNSVSSKSSIILSIQFPLAVLPISAVVQNGLKFLFALIPFFIGLLFYGVFPSWTYLWLPLIMLVQFMLNIGVALAVSVAGVYFRDLNNILQFILRIGFYLSPALYMLDQIPKNLLPLYVLNPFVGLMTSYKNVLVLHRPPEYLWHSLAFAIAILLFGWFYFVKMSHRIAKEL